MRMLQADDPQQTQLGLVERSNDLGNPREILCRVRDDEAVATWVHCNGVARWHKGTDRRHHLVCILMLQGEDASGRCHTASGLAHARHKKLGLRGGHHPHKAIRSNHREALQAQGGDQELIGLLQRDRLGGFQADASLDAGIDQKGHAHGGAECGHHLGNLHIAKGQHDRLSLLRRRDRRGHDWGGRAGGWRQRALRVRRTQEPGRE